MIPSNPSERVQAYFFDNPSLACGLNDIVANMNMAKTTATKIIKELEREGFLRIERLGKQWRITAAPDHPYLQTRKALYHFALVLESGIVERVRAAYPEAKAIVLFGSVRKGMSHEKSDIDIAVELPGAAPLEIVEFERLKIFGFRRDVLVQLVVFSRKNISSNVFANIANGFIIDGFLEVRP